jgi:hypothetical protein
MELKQELILENYVQDMDSETLFTRDVNWKNKGYKMTSITGYGTDEAKFTAIWDDRSMNDYTFTTDMTPNEFERVFNNLNSNGFTVQCISGYEVEGELRYAAIWERADVDQKIQYGMNAADLYKWNADYTDQGYRAVRLNSYNWGDAPAYACIWVKDNGPQTILKHNLTLATLESCQEEYALEGYYLAELTGCRFSGEPTFSAIWEQGKRETTKVDVAVPSEALGHWVGEMSSEGYKPARICGYPFNNSNYFAVVWRRALKSQAAA